MSVFAEFHKAWLVRFPGKDLPSAWEEDVRANLAKHRARAAILREDLEKEQFYVEYLERLLEDVQQHSRDGDVRGEGEGAPTPFTCIQDHVHETINSVLAEHSTPAAPLEDQGLKSGGGAAAPVNVKNLTRRFNKNTNSKSRPPAFLRSTSVPASSVTPSPPSSTHRLSSVEPSAFVTVIPISGDEQFKSNKKSPPAVPPKSFKHRPASQGDGEPRPPAPLPHQCLPTYPDSRPLHKSSSSSSSGSDRPSLVSKSPSAGSSIDAVNPRRPATPQAIPSDSDDGGDEPLYDTVAPDEDDDTSPFDTLKSGGSGGSFASKSGGSGGILSSPCGSPAPSDFIPPLHSPNYRNYVNLDFFLKR